MKHTLNAALGLALLALALPSTAQIAVKPSGWLRVYGDSTLHTWDSSATVINATVTLNEGAPAALADAVKATAVKSMTVEIPVAGLRSGESGLDKNMRKAMMDEKFPAVHYKLTKYELGKADAGVIPAKTTGELTIAGQTKTVSIDVEFRPGPDGVAVKGSYTLNMSEYGIKPPTLMLGAIKVRDPVTIKFDLLLKAGTAAKKP
jgi:hypothetical protein